MQDSKYIGLAELYEGVWSHVSGYHNEVTARPGSKYAVQALWPYAGKVHSRIDRQYIAVVLKAER